jgi:hypothetical protein
MPATLPHLQKTFVLSMHEGKPVGLVEKTDEGYMVKCCPLCGCVHHLIDVDMSMPYTPLCQSIPDLFKLQQTAWQKLNPTVSPFKSLHLSTVTG